MTLYNYYIKRVENNQTIRINSRSWGILGFDRNVDVQDISASDLVEHFKQAKQINTLEALQVCRNIKTPFVSVPIHKYDKFVVLKAVSTAKYTLSQFHNRSLAEKISLLKQDKKGYLYRYCTKNDLINILAQLGEEAPVSSLIGVLKNRLRETFKQNPLVDAHNSDEDSDSDNLDKVLEAKPHSYISDTSDSTTSSDDLDNTVIPSDNKTDTPATDKPSTSAEASKFSESNKKSPEAGRFISGAPKVKMSITPQSFSGRMTEDVNEYFKDFERISAANVWGDSQKLIMFPLYLREEAKILFEKIESETGSLTWSILKKVFADYYDSEEQRALLRENLNRRKKRPEESLQSYILRVLGECKRVDENMSQKDISKIIMKGFPQEVYWRIYAMDNSTVDKITANIRTYEADMVAINNNESEIEILRKEIEKLRVGRESNSSDEVRQLKEELERVKASINNRPFRNNGNFRGNSNNTGNFRGNPNNNSNNTRDRNYNNYNRASDNNSRNRNYNNNNRYNGNNFRNRNFNNNNNSDNSNRPRDDDNGNNNRNRNYNNNNNGNNNRSSGNSGGRNYNNRNNNNENYRDTRRDNGDDRGRNRNFSDSHEDDFDRRNSKNYNSRFKNNDRRDDRDNNSGDQQSNAKN
ncbi:bromodomain-containing protein DDB_G0280777-like [Adelges cooleyi]|uniref:bromodomain-containing protein DDB_G0280777-like n=1 Tax=Adelges cooleyi TaxID=133065 RepID=UPI0021801675|nr:bromodomain-containing protein DDB_G0280777-like [Adelges cooleyi]